MLFSLVTMAVVGKILHDKGYTMEKLIPFILIAGLIAYFIPIGAIIAWPFKALVGFVGLIIGLVAATIGLTFGLVGLIIGLIFLLVIPATIIFIIFKVIHSSSRTSHDRR